MTQPPKALKLSSHDFRSMPWKNGAGRSLELYRLGGDNPDFRISRAQVNQSAKFSSYPDHQRIIAILSGGPMHILHHERPSVTLKTYEVYSFDGALPTSCELDNAAEDFNVFSAKGKFKAAVSLSSGSAQQKVDHAVAKSGSFLYQLEGQATFTSMNTGAIINLTAGEALLIPLGLSESFRYSLTDPEQRLIAVRFQQLP